MSKKCKNCGVPKNIQEYQSKRTRICNTCKESVRQPKPTVVPEQKLTDAQMVAKWKKNNTVTSIKAVKEVFEPATTVEGLGQAKEYRDDGSRVYRNLNKTIFSAHGEDTNSRNYGGGDSSPSGD